MKQQNLVNHCYNENTHTYSVTIGTPLGQFTGEATCRPEDQKHEVSYFGYDLADIKAHIKYARAQKQNYKTQIKGLQDFLNNMRSTRTYDECAFWVKQLRGYVLQLLRGVKQCDEDIATLKEIYHLRVVTFDTTHKGE